MLTALAAPGDWADAAAVLDRALRVFSEAVRPVLRGLPASKLSHSNLLLLVVVAADETVRLADLIRDAHLIASNAGYALKALRDAGYVEVEMDPENRRARIVYATEEGRRVARIIRDRCRMMDAGGMASLLAEVDRFERGLEARQPTEDGDDGPRVRRPTERGAARASVPTVEGARTPPSKPMPTAHQPQPPPRVEPEMVPSLFGPVPGRLPRRRKQ